MANILHRILIKANSDKIYSLFSTPEGISQWWTRHVTAEDHGQTGTVMQFRFNSNTGPDMKVTLQVPGRRIEWECISGPEDWIGTRIYFDVEKYGDKSILHFGQTG
ncbi:MAG: hypothetical protein C5B59_11455 [Bacteroidetes bacterium]|nr:MAG: hypothetical protein C5B59_11455 [Bacteroidota bacterium]